jgi:hypothetical protein
MMLWVHGCHSIIYPVQLPAWLPADIVEKMIMRFQIHLRRELNVMMTTSQLPTPSVSFPKGHRHAESESNISIASSRSGQTPQFNTNFLKANEWAKDN